MTNKPIEEYVWPEKDYTDKIHNAVREIFRQSKFVSFTYDQLVQQLTKRFRWLTLKTEKQSTVLNKVIRTAIRKFTQLGLIKECKSKMSIERQWMWAQFINETSYENVTTEDEVAQTEIAINRCLHRAVSGNTLKIYNNQPY